MKSIGDGGEGVCWAESECCAQTRADVELIEFDIDSPEGLLDESLSKVDVIFHLAGVNRPERVEEFTEGNFDLTRRICSTLKRLGRKPLLLLSSSMQALLDNPYGVSKRQAEEEVFAFGEETGAQIAVFRLPGVFGKWCRPNYNSVVATFCHNIAHDLPIAISDPAKEIELVYIDDVVRAFINVMDGMPPVTEGKYCQAKPTYRITLGALAETIRGFRESRVSLTVPDVSDPLVHALYATYISYLPTDAFAYALTQRTDPRGELAELLKSPRIGQIFVSRTRPGITRGHHYHDTKVEKFVVLEGDAVIRFRHIRPDVSDQRTEIREKERSEDRGQGSEVIEYRVKGEEFRVVDIPPGYTHSIENVGQNDLIVLFWADEIFDPNIPDTYFEKVE